jgi:3-deoxy-7-phosphoheptulonate synthase
MDLNAVPLAKELSHLPIIVDPSHGTGKASLVPALARAGIAVGADGLIIEAHPNPAESFSDAAQTIALDGFAAMMDEVRAVARAVGRTA